MDPSKQRFIFGGLNYAHISENRNELLGMTRTGLVPYKQNVTNPNDTTTAIDSIRSNIDPTSGTVSVST